MMPAVVHLGGYLRVARLAQRHKVILVVSAAAGEGTDMVHLRCRCGLVVLQAHLTQGMLSDVAVPDAFPRSAVSFLDDRAALVGVIVFIHQLLVLLAVPVHGQLLAAGVGARFLWFPWQSSHLQT